MIKILLNRREIRGQIVPENQVAFANILSGANEVPGTTSTATGTIYSVYDRSAKELAYTIVYEGLEPTAMHFHKAAAGSNGEVELEVTGPYSSGMTGSVMLTDAQAADLLNGLWYLMSIQPLKLVVKLERNWLNSLIKGITRS